jgi:hypothetical protein
MDEPTDKIQMEPIRGDRSSRCNVQRALQNTMQMQRSSGAERRRRPPVAHWRSAAGQPVACTDTGHKIGQRWQAQSKQLKVTAPSISLP